MDRASFINRMITIVCVILIVLFGPWIFGMWSVIIFIGLAFLLVSFKLAIWETLFATLGLLLFFGFAFWEWDIAGLREPILSWFGALPSVVVWFLSSAVIALLVGLLTKNTKAIIAVVIIWSLVYFFAWGGDIPWFDTGNSSTPSSPNSPPSEDSIWW